MMNLLCKFAILHFILCCLYVYMLMGLWLIVLNKYQYHFKQEKKLSQVFFFMNLLLHGIQLSVYTFCGHASQVNCSHPLTELLFRTLTAASSKDASNALTTGGNQCQQNVFHHAVPAVH